MKIVYDCDFRKSLLLLSNHYHYFCHLNGLKMLEVLLSQKVILPSAKKK